MILSAPLPWSSIMASSACTTQTSSPGRGAAFQTMLTTASYSQNVQRGSDPPGPAPSSDGASGHAGRSPDGWSNHSSAWLFQSLD